MGRKKKVVMDEIEKAEQADAKPDAETSSNDVPAINPEPADELKGDRYKVVLSNKASYLNLRDGAGQDHQSIGKIAEGTIVEAVGEPVDAGDTYKWIPVMYQGKKGYIFSGKTVKL